MAHLRDLSRCRRGSAPLFRGGDAFLIALAFGFWLPALGHAHQRANGRPRRNGLRGDELGRVLQILSMGEVKVESVIVLLFYLWGLTHKAEIHGGNRARRLWFVVRLTGGGLAVRARYWIGTDSTFIRIGNLLETCLLSAYWSLKENFEAVLLKGVLYMHRRSERFSKLTLTEPIQHDSFPLSDVNLKPVLTVYFSEQDKTHKSIFTHWRSSKVTVWRPRARFDDVSRGKPEKSLFP